MPASVRCGAVRIVNSLVSSYTNMFMCKAPKLCFAMFIDELVRSVDDGMTGLGLPSGPPMCGPTHCGDRKRLRAMFGRNYMFKK